MTSEIATVKAVQKFLDLNYPCGCPEGDTNCPANLYEAWEIIYILENSGIRFDKP